MKTTLHIDDRVAAAAKRYAQAEGTTLTAVVNNALKQFLMPKARAAKEHHELRLKTRATGPQPGVDLEDRASLYDMMDEP